MILIIHLGHHFSQNMSCLGLCKIVFWLDHYLSQKDNTYMLCSWFNINILRPTQNMRHFADDIFKCIFLNENVQILIMISLNFIPKGQMNNIPALVQIMAWCQPGDKPLSEPLWVSLLTHICVTWPQWVKVSPACWDQQILLSTDKLYKCLWSAEYYKRTSNFFWLSLNTEHISLKNWIRIS